MKASSLAKWQIAEVLSVHWQALSPGTESYASCDAMRAAPKSEAPYLPLSRFVSGLVPHQRLVLDTTRTGRAGQATSCVYDYISTYGVVTHDGIT